MFQNSRQCAYKVGYSWQWMAFKNMLIFHCRKKSNYGMFSLWTSFYVLLSWVLTSGKITAHKEYSATWLSAITVTRGCEYCGHQVMLTDVLRKQVLSQRAGQPFKEHSAGTLWAGQGVSSIICVFFQLGGPTSPWLPGYCSLIPSLQIWIISSFSTTQYFPKLWMRKS